jgi:hypothetical protein
VRAQSRSIDPEERKRSARVGGWTIMPSHYLNNKLDTVWLAPS